MLLEKNRSDYSRNTIRRWVTVKTPIPDLVSSYLRAMQAIKDLDAATVAPSGGDGKGMPEDEQMA